MRYWMGSYFMSIWNSLFFIFIQSWHRGKLTWVEGLDETVICPLMAKMSEKEEKISYKVSIPDIEGCCNRATIRVLPTWMEYFLQGDFFCREYYQLYFVKPKHNLNWEEIWVRILCQSAVTFFASLELYLRHLWTSRIRTKFFPSSKLAGRVLTCY